MFCVSVFCATIYVVAGNKNPILVVQNHHFILNVKGRYKTWWRCSFKYKTRCKATLITYGKVVEIVGDHNHEPSSVSWGQHQKVFSQNVILRSRDHNVKF